MCGSSEHVVRFQMFEDDIGYDKELIMDVFLNHTIPWYKRIFKSIKYVLGYKCKFGDFDEVIISPGEAIKLRKLMDDFLAL